MVQTASLLGTQALGYELGSAVQLSKGRVVCGTVYGDMYYKNLGYISQSPISSYCWMAYDGEKSILMEQFIWF